MHQCTTPSWNPGKVGYFFLLRISLHCNNAARNNNHPCMHRYAVALLPALCKPISLSFASQHPLVCPSCAALNLPSYPCESFPSPSRRRSRERETRAEGDERLGFRRPLLRIPTSTTVSRSRLLPGCDNDCQSTLTSNLLASSSTRCTFRETPTRPSATPTPNRHQQASGLSICGCSKGEICFYFPLCSHDTGLFAL